MINHLFNIRTLVLLRVLYEFIQEHDRAPKQNELYQTRQEGLLHDWVQAHDDILTQHPFAGFSGKVHLNNALTELEKAGMIPERRRRIPYSLTEKGVAFAEYLTGDWEQWGSNIYYD